MYGLKCNQAADATGLLRFMRHMDGNCGSQFLALKRLTRHRLHLVECMTREKTYLISNLYLKFSELQMLEGDDQPFCDIYGATSSSVLMEYLSPEEILASSEEDLIAFLAEKAATVLRI